MNSNLANVVIDIISVSIYNFECIHESILTFYFNKHEYKKIYVLIKNHRFLKLNNDYYCCHKIIKPKEKWESYRVVFKIVDNDTILDCSICLFECYYKHKHPMEWNVKRNEIVW